MTTTTTQPKPNITTTHSIQYCNGIRSDWDYWAGECGLKPRQLRQTTETAIRSRSDEASIEHEADRARGRQPNIFALDLRSPRPATVYFTVEADVVVVRGYAWDLGREPLDDLEGGGFFPELSWDDHDISLLICDQP